MPWVLIEKAAPESRATVEKAKLPRLVENVRGQNGCGSQGDDCDTA